LLVLRPVPVGDGDENKREESARNADDPDDDFQGIAACDGVLSSEGTGQVELQQLQVAAVDDDAREGVEVVGDGEDEDEDVGYGGDEDDAHQPLVLFLGEEIHFAQLYNW
jgi:hypothetical protein